ncbi:sulfatase-like hydrolase/transferase [Chloroflexi bacterium TSY]|nr:sulfatase-like hydrolase/transferase [Chloroflexi bacterium TSY]
MSNRPNILLITSDQQHWTTLGSVNPKIKTPALDRLVAEGTRFDRTYCNNPVCSPSRSTIITGLYPSTHHCWTIGVKLPEDVPTVGELFSANGYDTTLIGKAHFQPLASQPGSESLECQPTLRDLDFWRNFHGPWYGFDHVEIARNHADEAHAGQHYGIWMEENGLLNWLDYFQEWPPNPDAPKRRHVWDLPEEFHYTTWTAERTIANIEKSVEADKPFFLWSSFHDPHPPYLVSEPWASMYEPDEMEPGRLDANELAFLPPHFQKTQEENPDFSMYRETAFGNHGFHSHVHEEAALRKDIAIYYGMVSFMDQQIGRILDRLDELGIAKNTLVVFSTDHGHFIGQHGLTAKGPFHYEDMLKLPFIVRYPGHVPPGTTNDALQGLIDLAPTFLEAAGIDVPGIMQGVSQLDVWRGEAVQARDHVLVENRHQPTAVHLRTYIDERYKMTIYRDHDYGELFDLLIDPNEIHNRWYDPDWTDVKATIMQRFLNAELQREPTRMPRIAGA